MRKVFRFCFILFLFSCTVFLSAPESSAQVVMNEFVADPARDWDGDGVLSSRDDEWVEIANIGQNAVNLAGYRFADGDGRPVWRYEFSGTLGPGAVRAIYGSDSKAWEESNGFPMYGLSLNNTGDRLRLYRIAGSDTALIDSYTYGEVAARKDRAIGRRTDSPDVWATFDAHNPCTSSCDPAGTGCYPTPNARNTCVTAAESRTWGAIKSMYR